MKKFVDIIMPKKGLLDLVPGNIANKEYSPNTQNIQFDEGVLKSRKGFILNSTADVDAYNTGTIKVKQGTTTITGIGTTWSSNLNAGDSITNLNEKDQSYIIHSVDSDTQVTLKRSYDGETTFQALSASNNYNSSAGALSLVFDGTDWWHIDSDGIDSTLYQWNTNPALGYSSVKAFTGYYMTGITYMNSRIWLAGQKDGHQYIYKLKANPADGIDGGYDMGYITGNLTPAIIDISNIGGTLYSYAGFWNTSYAYTEWAILKHDAGITTFTEYSVPTTYREMGLANDGTYLYGTTRFIIDGVLKDYISKFSLDADGLFADIEERFSPDISHDEGAGNYLVGVGYKSAASEIWVMRIDSGTPKLTQYSSTTTGDSYTAGGVTDNLYNFKKWDGTETLVWSTIPKGMAAYSKNAKDWYLLKTAMNDNKHMSFVVFMNYVFCVNGQDTAWCWDGSDKVDGECTSNGNVGGTTVIDTSFTEADDYWNGCVMVMTTGDNAGEIREISDWANGTNTFTVSVAFSNQTSTGDDFYVVYTVDDPNEIDGSGNITHDAARGSMPRGQVIENHQNRLWVTDKDHPNVIRCSGLFFLTDTGMDDTWDAEQELQIANDDTVTGMYSAGDILYIFSNHRTYVVTGGPSFSTYRVIPLKKPVGLISDRGAQVKDNYALFASRNGVYEILGQEINELSDGIKNIYQTIQQTTLYHEQWILSSESEFDSGAYDNNKIIIAVGDIRLKDYFNSWNTTAEWNGKVDSARVGIESNNVSLLQYEDEKGESTNVGKLSANFAPSLYPFGFSPGVGRDVGGSHRNVIDGNRGSSYIARFGSGSYHRAFFTCWWSGLKDIRQVYFKYRLYHSEGAPQSADVYLESASGDWSFSSQYSTTISVPAGAAGTTDSETQTFSGELVCDKIEVRFGTHAPSMIVEMFEIEIYEWFTRVEYSSTYPYYDDGYIIVQHDTGATSPQWGKFGIDIYLPNNNVGYSMSARVSSNGSDWDSWQSFSDGDVPACQRKRYIQIRIYLQTDAPGSGSNKTPTLNSFIIRYYKDVAETYTSPAQNLSSDISAWDIFEVSTEIPYGTSLKFEVTSADVEGNLGSGSYPWVEITPGTKPTGYFNSSGNTWFQWRVTLYTTNDSSPTVSSVAIWWFEGGQQITPICSIFYQERYYLSGAVSNESGVPSRYNNMVLVLNKQRNFEKMIGLNTSGLVEFKNRLYGGASDSSFIYLLEEGYNDNGNLIECFTDTMNYDFNYEFRKNLSDRYKNLLRIRCEGKITQANIQIGYSFDNGKVWDYVDIDTSRLRGHETIGDLFSALRTVPFGKQGKQIRFRVRGSTMYYPIEIHRLQVEIEPTNIMGA